MHFEHKKDKQFFADLLCNGDADRLEKNYRQLFDFRPAVVKRKEFNAVKARLKKTIVKNRGARCELMLVPGCATDTGLVLDHFIPLSSNELNKKLRRMRAGAGRKVKSQSLGSNDPKNLLLACARCNNFKKHRIVSLPGKKGTHGQRRVVL